MNANLVFRNILAAVENSYLTHTVYKTPFSATISLKSSFMKYCSENQHEEQNSCRCDKITTEEIKVLTSESIEMKAKIKTLENKNRK